MKIIGDTKIATKFYIVNSHGSIEWVPNLEIAKKYVSDPSNVEWYNVCKTTCHSHTKRR